MKGLAYLLILSANLVGGLTYPWQKLALTGLPPATVAVLRNVIALLCMGVWLAVRGGLQWRYAPADLARLAVVGILAYAAPLLMGVVGVQWSTAANGAILILLEPASILVLSWLLLREPIRRLQILGFGVGLAGALVIVLADAPLGGLLSEEHLLGNVVLAAHGILWGLYSPVMKPLAVRYRPLDLTFASMVLGMVLLVPAALLEADRWVAGPDLPDALWRTLELGVVGSFLATVAWTWSLRWLPASSVAPFVFVQPLAGVVAGHFVLGEVLTPAALLGGLLIGASVLCVLLPTRRRPPAAHPDPG